MSESSGDTQHRTHALLLSSDRDFIERVMDVLHSRMRVALVSAADNHLEAVAKSTDPDLFIIDIDDVDWQITGRMTAIEQTRSMFPDVPIAFTSYDISTATLIPAMRAGANDVFDKNASSDEIIAVTDQLTNHRRTHSSAGDGRVITAMGLRAGVGTTTLALALAQTVVESDEALGPVLYLDFSAAPCEVADLVGVEPNYTMLDAVSDLGRLDGSVVESAFSRSQDGLYVLPFALEDVALDPQEANEIPNLVAVLKSHFRFIFVDPNRNAFSSAVFDRLFCDSDVPILCTDQSVTSIHACTNFLHNVRQFVRTEPNFLLAITRYDPRISPNANRIAQAVGIGEEYHIVPSDRRYVDERRNAALPLIHSGARSPFAESTRRLMARIDEEYAAARSHPNKRSRKWRKLMPLMH